MFGTSIDVMDLVNISGLLLAAWSELNKHVWKMIANVPLQKKAVDIDDKAFGMEDLSVEMWTVHIM